jgi:hypothetical protein
VYKALASRALSADAETGRKEEEDGVCTSSGIDNRRWIWKCLDLMVHCQDYLCSKHSLLFLPATESVYSVNSAVKRVAIAHRFITLYSK